VSAAIVDPVDRGVSFRLHEGGIPVRLRACHFSDDNPTARAQQAELLRRAHYARSPAAHLGADGCS
jgi:hypothetical protein